MKILLLISSFNSLSQRVYCELKDLQYEVSMVIVLNKEQMIEEVSSINPDIIFCPFLKQYLPAAIFNTYDTFILHPGIRGDRGHHSLDHAINKQLKEWGVVILKANEELDGGNIYASSNFSMRDTTKASIYRNEICEATSKALKKLLINLEDKNFKALPQIQNEIHQSLKQEDRKINWQKDNTKTILKKINMSDSYPGVKENLLGVECFLYAAHEEDTLKGKSKEILAKRDGAICIGTIDGAVWISHLKEDNKFKLPSTYVLKDKIKGVKERRIPLIYEQEDKTFHEIYLKKIDEVAYLYFNFHNAAMNSEQAIRLKYAIEYLKDECKVLVLMGGNEFFSNGIHLNILEDSKKQGEDGWSNINAMNDVIKSVIFASNIITVASFGKNAGAGGVFLGLACDYVIGCEGVILNPHYKSMGLTGSEYHTYIFNKRVKENIVNKILTECLPISTKYAKKIGMLDKVFENENYFSSLNKFCQDLQNDETKYYDFIDLKEEYLEENSEKINLCKEKELKIMHSEFWDEESSFHKLRHKFVYKN